MRGDGEDFKGIDIIFYNDCKEKITIKVKSGKIIETNEIGYVIQSSVNDLKSDADYYCFVDITDNNTKIVTFQNLKNYIIRGNPNHTFRKEILQPIQIDEHMKTPEILQKMAEFVYTKPDLIFELQYVKSDTNLMEIKDKVINVIIGNFLDENLPNQLSEFLNELEQRFQ